MSNPDHEPEQQQIDHWLKVSQEGVDERLRDGFEYFKERDLPLQTFYLSMGSAYKALGRAQFLNGEPESVFRGNFQKGAAYILKNFHMVYDKNDPDYVGDLPATDHNGFGYDCVDWYNVNERILIEGMQRAFMAGDFGIAKALANIFQDPAEQYSIDQVEVRRYAHALKHLFLGEEDEAKTILKPNFDKIKKKLEAGQKTSNLFALNYMLQSYPLYGILHRDEKIFNDGLMFYLAYHQREAQGESKDTDNEFVCDEAVALANLGIHFNLRVLAEHHTLPKGLLIDSSDYQPPKIEFNYTLPMKK